MAFSIKFKKKNSNPLGTVPTEQSITDYYDIFKKETAIRYIENIRPGLESKKIQLNRNSIWSSFQRIGSICCRFRSIGIECILLSVLTIK